MNFLRRLLAKPDQTVVAMPKAASIYHSNRSILIATTYWDTTGWSGGGAPMVLLPVDATAVAIGEATLQSIASSESGLSQENLMMRTAALLLLADATNWDALEAHWDLVSAWMEPDEERVTICGMRRGQNGGYVMFSGDPLHRCRREPEAVGEVVRDTMRGCFAIAEQQASQNSEAVVEDERRSPTEPLLNLGDRVVDLWGNQGTVTYINRATEHGIGIVRVLFEDGSERDLALGSSGLERVDRN